MLLKVVGVFAVGLAMLIPAAHALDPARPLRTYIHSSWQPDDGLPQSYVQSIVQTRDGYLWLATQAGLVRFDGVNFTVFDTQNTPQITENNIQVLYEDRDANLWIGTDGGGLVRFKDNKFTGYTIADGLADDIVEAIYEDHSGSLWIGTLKGLTRFSQGVFTRYTVRDGLANGSVLSICESSDGSIWVGTEGGLSRMVDGRFTTFNKKDGLPDDLVRSVVQDRAGNLWLATRQGLAQFSGGKFNAYSVADGLPSNSVTAICEDSNGSMWVGTLSGLARRSGGRFETDPAQSALTPNGIAAICEDREGSLWLGTYGDGLQCLKNGKLTAYTSDNGLSNDVAQAVFQDSKGSVWIGTRSGLNCLANGKFRTFTTKDGLCDNWVLSIAEDPGGDLWLGTSSGMSRYSHGRFTSYRTAQGLSYDTVLSICPGSGSGVLWIGTASGLCTYDRNRFSIYTIRDGLPSNSISCLLQGPDNVLWIGTDGGGLSRLQNGAFTNFATADGLCSGGVLSLYRDQDSRLWIGTAGGLNLFQNGKFSAFTMRDGLPSNVVYQILEGAGGILWMSSDKGIFSAGKTELLDYAAGKATSISCLTYGAAEGMKSSECNGGFQPAGCKTTDGKLWFPTMKGVAVVDPQRVWTNRLPAPAVIEGLAIDGSATEPRDGLRIHPGTQKFEFHYAGLSFVAPRKVRFKYKLSGFDQDWVDAGTRRDASYTNISPGHYRFSVIASNNDGVWSQAPATLDFYLEPYFYQTYWFYSGCALLLGLAALSLYRLRLRQVRSRFSAVLQERNRIAREIHDTLAHGFAGISMQLESVDETMATAPDLARVHLDNARRLARTSLAEARRSVMDLRSAALESGNLGTALAQAAQQISTAVPIEVSTSGRPVPLPLTMENSLLQIGREAMTNAIKHAGARRVRVELAFQPQHVRLSVLDDGCGFDPLAARPAEPRFGLATMRERAAQMGADLRIQSIPGQGTDVIITAPVP
jgi:ligand-binding sensor domain-containing protein/two-component sensor histidine kinase